MTTKRTIERRLEALERRANAGTEKERLELHLGGGLMYEPEPKLTDTLRSLGFVVEREEQVYDSGDGAVMLHTTPWAHDVFNAVCWHYGGPTTMPGAVRIVWEDERLERVLADAEHPVEYVEAEPPADPIVVDEGEGWKALAPAEQVITKMVQRRSDAEYHGFEILGPVELPLQNAAEYDLVEVDADPDEDRQPNLPDV